MFACIYIPDFSVEAVLRAEPMLRGQAVAVLEGAPPLCYVVGVNNLARHMGVQVGMTKMQVEPSGKSEKRQSGKTGKATATEKSKAKNEERGTKQEHSGERRAKAIALQGSIAERVQQRTTEVGYWHGSLYRSSAGESLVATTQQSRSRKVSEGMIDLILRQRSAVQETSAHAALLDAAYAISPRVEDTAVDTVVLDVAGLERLFGTSQQVAQELSRRVVQVGLQGNVAIAANVDTAEHAARGFNGVTIVPAGREAERLGSLPLEVLFQAELGAMLRQEKRSDKQRKALDRLPHIQETLDRWGIRDFRGLATLPPISLSERLGTDGVRLQMLASGSGKRELVLRERGLHFEEMIELEYPVDVLEPLAFLLARMLEGLCGRLNARSLSTNELRLRMRLEHRTSDEAAKSEEELPGEPMAERKITLPVPMNDAKLLLKLLQLELSASPPGAPVTQLWLTAEPARPRVGQAGLFMPLAPEAQKLELTLARIHKLLGVRDALRAGSAELPDTHEPDAFRIIRFMPSSEEERQSGKTAKRQSEDQSPSDLALRRCRPPFAAVVEMRDGLPVRLLCAELGSARVLHDNIVWAAGPWRSSGNWWERQRQNSETAKQQNEIRADSEETKGGSITAAKSVASAHRDIGLRSEAQLEGVQTPEWAWDREEWDVALAMTVCGTDRHERETQIGLYRLVRDCANERWSVEGSYD